MQTRFATPSLPQNDSVSPTRGAAVAAWWPWLALPATATGLVGAGLALGLTDPDGSWIQGEAWINVPLAIGFSTVAAGIWSTRPHTVGLTRLATLYTVVGLAAACVLPAFGWARIDAAGAASAAWVSNWVWSLGAAPLLGLGLLLYPDGHLPTRRWWPAPAVAFVGLAALTASAGLRPGPSEDHPGFTNPTGVGTAAFWDFAGGVGFGLVMVGAAAGIAALVVKFRRAPTGGDVRAQIGGFALAGVLIVIIAPLPGTGTWNTLVAVAAITALPVTIGSAVLHHQLLDQRSDVEGLNRRVRALTASRRSIVNEREDERVRLRRDLHDGLGPSLAAIGLGLRQLEHSLSSADVEAVRSLGDEVQRAVAEVRRLCDGLRPAALNELGLAGALVEGIEPLRRVGPRITLHFAALPPLTPAVEVAAYRIVMEAVTNAVRHAEAQELTVTVRRDQGLCIEVADDGRGVPDSAPPGVGLRGMSDRADEVGGSLRISGMRPTGTVVEAWLPAMEDA